MWAVWMSGVTSTPHPQRPITMIGTPSFWSADCHSKSGCTWHCGILVSKKKTYGKDQLRFAGWQLNRKSLLERFFNLDGKWSRHMKRTKNKIPMFWNLTVTVFYLILFSAYDIIERMFISNTVIIIKLWGKYCLIKNRQLFMVGKNK